MHEIIKRLKVFFAVLVRLFSRLLCWRRNRRNSGSLLPITVVTTGGGNSSSALVQPQNAQYMYSTSSIVHSYTNNVNNTWNLVNKHPTSQPEQDKTDTEPDYFQDIQPTIKRQKKVSFCLEAFFVEYKWLIVFFDQSIEQFNLIVQLLIRSEEECKLSERLNFNSAYIQVTIGRDIFKSIDKFILLPPLSFRQIRTQWKMQRKTTPS